MKEKVLLSFPTSVFKDYVLNDFVTLIKNLDYDNYDILCVDNSKSDRSAMWAELGIKSIWYNPTNETPIEFITNSQNVIRDYFLEHKEYSHLMFIESDLLPNPNCMGILLAHDKPVVGLPYFIQKGNDTVLMLEEIELKYRTGLTRINTLQQSFSGFDGKLYRTFHLGFGCVLFKRFVIEKIKFRCVPDSKVKNNAIDPSHSDSFFYPDCVHNKIPVFVDKSYIVPHYNQNYLTIDFK